MGAASSVPAGAPLSNCNETSLKGLTLPGFAWSHFLKIQSNFLEELANSNSYSGEYSVSAGVLLSQADFENLLPLIADVRYNAIKKQMGNTQSVSEGDFSCIRNFLLSESSGKECETYPNPDLCEPGEGQVSWCEMEVILPAEKEDVVAGFFESSLEQMRAVIEETAVDADDGAVTLNQLSLVRDEGLAAGTLEGRAHRDFILSHVLPGLIGTLVAAGTSVHSLVLCNNGLCNGPAANPPVGVPVGEDHSPPSEFLSLNLASNPMCSWSTLDTLRYCPPSLLVLDLSYCAGVEGRELALCAGCFLGCPQLVRLVLDGCGLTSTMCHSVIVDSATQQHSALSVFFGLVCLQELSLIDNQICSDNTMLAGIVPPTPAGVGLLSALKHLAIIGNPCTDTAAEYATLKHALYAGLPALVDIDGYPCELVVKATDATIASKNRGSSTHGITTSINSNTSSDLNLANEKEFLCALKGEKDHTVVA